MREHWRANICSCAAVENQSIVIVKSKWKIECIIIKFHLFVYLKRLKRVNIYIIEFIMLCTFT